MIKEYRNDTENTKTLGKVRGCRDLPENTEMGGGEGLSRATATALVTTGSEILQRLEQLGPYELLRLKIHELHTLLVNSDGRFFAVAVAYAAQAPPLLPIPFAPAMCERGRKHSKFEG